jgi:hypothetical protein
VDGKWLSSAAVRPTRSDPLNLSRKALEARASKHLAGYPCEPVTAAATAGTAGVGLALLHAAEAVVEFHVSTFVSVHGSA